MINFSHIGRYAPKESRDAHDSSWRDDHIRAIKALYPDVVVEKGGQISLDIHSAGADKSRAAKYINETLRKDFVFLGDRTEEGGNDYPVKKYCDECPKNVCLQVNSIEDTFAIIDALLMKGVSI